MNSNLEVLIATALFKDSKYADKYLPHFRTDYFTEPGMNLILKVADNLKKYNSPTLEQIHLELESQRALTETIVDAKDLASEAYNAALPSGSWLELKTEEFILRERQRYLVEQLAFARDDGSDLTPILKELAAPPVFEATVGLDSDSPDFIGRVVESNQVRKVIPFEHEDLNKSASGVRPGTINVAIAATNVGKTLVLGDFACGYLRSGLDVLYLSGELSDTTIVNRLVANLTETPVDDLKVMNEVDYVNRWQTASNKIGRFVVRDYPTGQGNVSMFRRILTDLRDRHGFTPQIVIVDHIQNCKCEMNLGASLNLYQMYGLVAKEFRVLAQEFDVPIWTAAQANRAGAIGKITLTNIGDSWQIAQDCDLALLMWRDQDMEDYIRVSAGKLRDAGDSKERLFFMDTKYMKLRQPEDAAKARVEELYRQRVAAESLAETKKSEKPKKRVPPQFNFTIDEEILVS